MSTEETSTCVACGGTVVKNTTTEYLGDPRNMIIGPGSRDQMTHVTKIHCTSCGLKYEFLPPLKPDRNVADALKHDFDAVFKRFYNGNKP